MKIQINKKAITMVTNKGTVITDVTDIVTNRIQEDNAQVYSQLNEDEIEALWYEEWIKRLEYEQKCIEEWYGQ